MTTYALGNVNGDYPALLRLLDHIHFDQQQDSLWFSGNIVNGGGDSLEILRFVKKLGKQAVLVIGHQELRLLAIAEDIFPAQVDDRFTELLASPDKDELITWLRNQPFIHSGMGYTLVHAGIPAEWSLSQTLTLAMEAETSLSMGNHKTYLENMFEAGPTRWHAKHRGWKRVRFITHALTRLRYYGDKGRIDFDKQALEGDEFDAFKPWFQVDDRAMAKQKIIFNSWPNTSRVSVAGIFPLANDGDSVTALEVSATPIFHTLPKMDKVGFA